MIFISERKLDLLKETAEQGRWGFSHIDTPVDILIANKSVIDKTVIYSMAIKLIIKLLQSQL